MTTKIKSTIPGAALPGYPAFPWLPPFLVQVVAVDSVPNKGISYRMYLCVQHTFKHPRGCFHVNKPFCGCMCVDLRGKKQQIFFCCFKKEKKKLCSKYNGWIRLKRVNFLTSSASSLRLKAWFARSSCSRNPASSPSFFPRDLIISYRN